MKCQSWVDPAKFRKDGTPGLRSMIGTYLLDWDRYVEEVKGTLREKRETIRARAVRCGGHLTFAISADCDEQAASDLYVDLRCEWCGEYVHSVGLNAEVVEQWIQERLDAMP